MNLRLISFSAMVALVVPFSVFAVGLDGSRSSMSADHASLRADGIDNAQVTVTVKNTNDLAIPGVTVSVQSSRSMDEIREIHAQTDTLGKAYFRVTSLKDGTSEYHATMNGLSINKSVSILYSNGLSFPLNSGDLIKIPDDNNMNTLSDTAVYYYGKNGKRYVFPNEKAYFTWYKDFSNVKILPLDQMSLIPIGGNVTYRPGTRMVKFQTDVKTYIVTRGGVLRWVATEDVARNWFGASWNTHVDDVSEAFFANYKFGEPVNSSLDLALPIVRDDVPTIDTDKRL